MIFSKFKSSFSNGQVLTKDQKKKVKGGNDNTPPTDTTNGIGTVDTVDV